MIGVIPAIFVLLIVIEIVQICLDKDNKEKISDIILYGIIGAIIGVLVIAVTGAITVAIVTPKITSVKICEWKVIDVRPKTVEHQGSKGRVYTTENFHVLVDMNNGTSKVSSILINDVSIKQGNVAVLERYDNIKTNKVFTILFGFKELCSTTSYVLYVPDPSKIL